MQITFKGEATLHCSHNFDTSANWSVSMILTLSWRRSNLSRREIFKPYTYIAILLQASVGLKVLR